VGFPAGRPEASEDIEETLRRELWEEAGVRVVSAQLLGFARSECIAGSEAGLVLVRSYWRAGVEVLAWQPQLKSCIVGSSRRLRPGTSSGIRTRWQPVSPSGR
jgi:8-oxo-dGTP pyrophosphatase MutT (NUDIX family)